jgi:hypothetical protein
LASRQTREQGPTNTGCGIFQQLKEKAKLLHTLSLLTNIPSVPLSINRRLLSEKRGK